jgi:hypothetical protein
LEKINVAISNIRWPVKDVGLGHLGKWLKMAEKMKFAGPVGRWVLSLLDLDEQYREKFMDALEVMHAMQAKIPLAPTKAALKTKMVETFAWLEWKLPLYWC